MPPDAAAPAATDEVAGALRARLGDDLLDVSENWGGLIVRVAPSRRPEALAVLKAMGFTFYSFACGVDRIEDGEFDVLDHVYRIEDRLHVTLKCSVPRLRPRVPSATAVYRGADWHERETWELFGIVFAGHPRLRRLLLADWQEGFPMRKDAPLRARMEKPWPGEFFSG